jgi:lipoprotein signal peptidase
VSRILISIKRVSLTVFIFGALTLPVDQFTKQTATMHYLLAEDPDDTTIYQGRRHLWFSLESNHAWLSMTKTYVRNHGASWGIWSNLEQKWRLMGLLLAGFIAWASLFWMAMYLWACGRPSAALALCGVLAGSVGNLWDRLSMGYVIDILTIKIGIGTWTGALPSFNVADGIIILSLICLLVTLKIPMKSEV